MIPNILKNFNAFVDGRGYAGKIEELTLPKLTKKTEEFMGAGMSAPVEIEMSLEKLEMDMTFVEYDAELFKLWGATNGTEVPLTIRGAIQGTGDPIPVVINVNGYFRELDFDTWKPAEKATLKCSMALNYYKLTVNNSVLIEVDPVNMINRVNGNDTLSGIRNILQV